VTISVGDQQRIDARSAISSRTAAVYSPGPAPSANSIGFGASLAVLTCSPRIVQASAASVATLRELVTIPISRPRGKGWLSNSSAAWNSSSPLRKRTTPA
jgi:hypothetical protein